MTMSNDDYVKDIEEENDSLRSQLAEVQEELDERIKEEKERNTAVQSVGHGSLSGVTYSHSGGAGGGGAGSYMTYDSNDCVISARYPEYNDTKINVKNGLTVYADDEEVFIDINYIKKIKALIDKKSWSQRIKDRWAKITKKNLKEDAKN